jgi:hypothetical protein
MTFTLNQTLNMDGTALQDAGQVFTGTGVVQIDEVVPANGQSPEAIGGVIPIAGLQCLFAIASVPCVLDINSTDNEVTLPANVLTRIEPTVDCDGLSIGANTTASGPAGTLKIRALYDATP